MRIISSVSYAMMFSKMWFKCTVNRIRISRCQLRRPPRIITDLLSQLRIKCEFETYDCETVCQLSQISEHEKTCNYRSDTMALCRNGCGLQASRHDLKQHSCIKFLREKIELQDQKISTLQKEIKNLKSRNHSSTKRKKPKRKQRKKNIPQKVRERFKN